MRCALRSTGDILLQSAQLDYSVQTRQLRKPFPSSQYFTVAMHSHWLCIRDSGISPS
ncbi:hypothetical protein [Rubritalea tangerina]|uniref:hypothetical protein n=1 Tax=Rubritalea tangerina TaxID=430798 RepID=UPI00360FDB78